MGLPGIIWVPVILLLIALLMLIISVITIVVQTEKPAPVSTWAWWVFFIGVMLGFVGLVWIGIHARNFGQSAANFTSLMPTSPGDDKNLVDSGADAFGIDAINEE